jgi:hypothetical protein
MDTKKTPEELRQQLIAVLQNEIVPGLKFAKNGHKYDMKFVTLTSRDVCTMITDQHTSTDLFGKLINELRRDIFSHGARVYVEKLHAAFWWPAVDKVWPLQCFQLPATGDDGKNDRNDVVNVLYMLARTGPDEWIGVTTFINYTPTE